MFDVYDRATFRMEFFDDDGDLLKKVRYFSSLRSLNDYVLYHFEDVELFSIDEFMWQTTIDVRTDDWGDSGFRVTRL